MLWPFEVGIMEAGVREVKEEQGLESELTNLTKRYVREVVNATVEKHKKIGNIFFGSLVTGALFLTLYFGIGTHYHNTAFQRQLDCEIYNKCATYEVTENPLLTNHITP